MNAKFLGMLLGGLVGWIGYDITRDSAKSQAIKMSQGGEVEQNDQPTATYKVSYGVILPSGAFASHDQLFEDRDAAEKFYTGMISLGVIPATHSSLIPFAAQIPENQKTETSDLSEIALYQGGSEIQVWKAANQIKNPTNDGQGIKA